MAFTKRRNFRRLVLCTLAFGAFAQLPQTFTRFQRWPSATAPLNVHFTPTQDRIWQNTFECNLPRLLILVLTANRPQSLERLFHSLVSADYGCARVDLEVNIDMPFNPGRATQLCVDLAADLDWEHGQKIVRRRMTHVGLSRSWFEAPYASGHEYIAVFEDDMEVGRNFFQFFSLLHNHSSLSSSEITAMCLHPNDWEVNVHRTCSMHASSPFLYLSPEPCNWGPIWKYHEWRQYIDWVFSSNAQGELPFVPDEYAYNYNKYLRDGKDVQSSWVWRYNFEYGKRQLRYSFVRCEHEESATEKYFAINHKEAGEHFKKKIELENDPDLLNVDFDTVLKLFLATRNAFLPSLFPGYQKGAKSLHG